ncbi:MAG: hypothetical protein M0R47_15795 [Methylobacter sp.]|uniref:hypothetical protein n=1 Tax=Methylobacter sp. TaxID=2051955 RepID=UPI0025CC88F5|nr:hypothetical protein [Methylobacter sp.]MCK9621983.1 hypothetical protein [Methylobacter sp.]
MNKTESAYSQHLELQKRAGEVLWFAFDAVKLRLADNTFLSVDFFVMTKGLELQAIDVKGSMAIATEDAKAKMKFASDKFPFRFFYVVPVAKKNGGGWNLIEV